MAIAATEQKRTTPGGTLRYIPLVHIKAASNVRQGVGDIAELTESIKVFGVLQPLTVRPENGHYALVAGFRRHAAATAAKLVEVPCLVRNDLVDANFTAAQLIENLQRVDLDPLEEAGGYQQLVKLGLKQKDIAGKVGRSEAHVSKRLALLGLPERVHLMVTADKLTIADALELVPYAGQAEVIAETLKGVDEAIRNRWGFRVGDIARNAKARLEREQKLAAIRARLKAEKVSLITTRETHSLTRLGKGPGELPLTQAEHAKSPCHAAYIDEYSQSVHYVCTKPANHKTSENKTVAKAAKALSGHRGYGGEKATKDAAKKAAQSRERNKVLRERAPLRAAELKRLLTARQKREEVLDFILRQLLQRFLDESSDVEQLAATILSVEAVKKERHAAAEVDWAQWLQGGSDRLFRLAYAVSLASGERPFQKLLELGYFDEEYSANAARYLEHLKANGYKADKVEVAQLTPANKYRWRKPFDEGTRT